MCCGTTISRLGSNSAAWGRCWLRLSNLLAIQTYEIYRIEQQWREAAVSDCVRNDLTRKWEQQTRALDHDNRIKTLLRYIANAKNSGEFQFESKQYRRGSLGFAV